MTEVRLELFCNADFREPTRCRRFVEALASLGPAWMPERFGAAEPLRLRWKAEGERGWCANWSSQTTPSGGDVLFRTSKKLDARGWIYWRGGVHHDFNSIVISVPEANCDAACTSSLLKLGLELVRDFGVVYGYVVHSEDFDRQHRQTTATGYKYVGTKLTAGLGGVYWANILSAGLVAAIGEERLQEAPFRERIPSDGAIAFLVGGEPQEFATEHGATLRRQIRSAIGKEFFFDVESPNRDLKPTWPRGALANALM